MALYQNAKWVTATTHAAFDTIFKPGNTPDHSGIYRCLGCGREVVAEQSRTLPPQNHHQHTTAQGDVRWQLAVYAEHDAK
jgi:hypothetical protein